jgi:5-oxoprolinase (ATP-hydrolysing)
MLILSTAPGGGKTLRSDDSAILRTDQSAILRTDQSAILRTDQSAILRSDQSAILRSDGGRMRVGPESAGRDPGPAAYGCGGPPTVADAAVVTGRLRPDHFPARFGPGGDRPLDAAAARAAVTRLALAGTGPEETAEGFLRVAVANMADDIATIADPEGELTGHGLALPVGAGAQHACALADILGLEACLVHLAPSPPPGADAEPAAIRASRTVAMGADLDDRSRLAAAARLDALSVETMSEVEARGVRERDIALVQTLHLRMKGSDTVLPVAFDDLARLRTAFARAHRARHGSEPGDVPLAIDSVQCEAIGTVAASAAPSSTRPAAAAAARTAPVFIAGVWTETRFVHRAALRVGDTLAGPAALVEGAIVILVEPGWRARLTDADQLELVRARRSAALRRDTQP